MLSSVKCRFAISLVSVVIATSSQARVASYLPSLMTLQSSWTCDGRKPSSLALQTIYNPLTTELTVQVTQLHIAGRSMGVDQVAGLAATVKGLAEVQTITARCGRQGEHVIFFGWNQGKRGPDQIVRHEFLIPYAR